MSRILFPFLLLTSLSSWAVDFRVGVVDTQRILVESAPSLKAEERIRKDFEARELEIKKLLKQAKDIQTQLEKDGASLPDADRRSKERELSNLNSNAQRLQREYGEDLNQRKDDELRVVLEMTNKAIQSIAESEHYDLILQEAVYRNPKIDITDKVLKYLAGEDKPADAKPAKK